MDDNNQTSGQPKPEPEECVKEQKITDHFKIMILMLLLYVMKCLIFSGIMGIIKKGGMWSQDYTTTDKYSTCKEDEVSYDEHIRIATKLISKQKDQIFENAYNIERYFEIRLIESEIDSINDEILSNSVKKKIAELEKALLH